MRMTPEAHLRLVMLLESDSLSVLGQIIALRRLCRHELADAQIMEDHFDRLMKVNSEAMPYAIDAGVAIDKARRQYISESKDAMLRYGEHLFAIGQIASSCLDFSDVCYALNIGIADQEEAHEYWCRPTNAFSFLLHQFMEDTADRDRGRKSRYWPGQQAASIAFQRYFVKGVAAMKEAGLSVYKDRPSLRRREGNVTYLGKREARP